LVYAAEYKNMFQIINALKGKLAGAKIKLCIVQMIKLLEQFSFVCLQTIYPAHLLRRMFEYMRDLLDKYDSTRSVKHVAQLTGIVVRILRMQQVERVVDRIAVVFIGAVCKLLMSTMEDILNIQPSRNTNRHDLFSNGPFIVAQRGEGGGKNGEEQMEGA